MKTSHSFLSLPLIPPAEASRFLHLVNLHYASFRKTLSKNSGINFDFSRYNIVLSQKTFTSYAHKTGDGWQSFRIFQIWSKFQLQGLNFKLELLDKKWSKMAIVPPSPLITLLRSLSGNACDRPVYTIVYSNDCPRLFLLQVKHLARDKVSLLK